MGRFALLIGLAPALTAAVPATAQPQANAWVAEQHAEDALDNVVRIEPAGAPSGAGFFIGRVADRVWIATAAHVVFAQGDDENDFETPRPNITMRMRDGRVWPADGPPQRGFGGDLAFVPFRMPRNFAWLWHERVIEADAGPGAPVRIAATATSVAYDEWDGETAGDGAALAVTGLDHGRGGQSGAPIFAGRGFVGMYLGSTGERMLPIETVRSAALRSNLPWDLVAYPPRPVAVRVCLDVVGAPLAALRLNSLAGGMATPDATGCASTMSGPATLFVDRRVADYRCSPGTPNLPREPEQRLPVTCSPELEGIWRAGAYGTVTFTSAGDGQWNVSGLQQAPFGAISGHASLIGNQLSLQGRSGLQAIVGTLAAGPGRLAGTLLVDGQPYAVELLRP